MDPLSRQHIKKLMNSNEKYVELDMGAIESMDSTGIDMIAKLATALKKRGGKLKVIGVKKHIYDVMEICSMDKIAEVHPC